MQCGVDNHCISIHTSVAGSGFVGGEGGYELWRRSSRRSKHPHQQPNHENFLKECFAAELCLLVVCGFPWSSEGCKWGCLVETTPQPVWGSPATTLLGGIKSPLIAGLLAPPQLPTMPGKNHPPLSPCWMSCMGRSWKETVTRVLPGQVLWEISREGMEQVSQAWITATVFVFGS